MMTDPNTSADNVIPEAVVVDGEKRDFRSYLTAEKLAAIKSNTPAFAKKLLADISALTAVDEKLDGPIEVQPDPEAVKLDEYVAEAEPEAVKPEPENRFIGIFNKVKEKASHPVATYGEARNALPKLRDDLDAQILRLETKLQDEKAKIALETEFSAKLEDVLEHFKTELPENTSLSGTIEQIEKKLLHHRVRVAARNAAVPTIQGAINTQRSVRSFVSSKLSK
jgi:hypothetical protein